MEMEKTKFLQVKGKKVSVDEFPKNIRDEVDFFDSLKRDALEQERQLKIVMLALSAQNLRVMGLIEKESGSTTEPQSISQVDPVND